MKNYFFISGLPRSGSTLLSSILSQNPKFYSSITSPVMDIVTKTIESMTIGDWSFSINEEKRKNLLYAIFDGYYKDVEQSVVFDTNREWTSKTSLLKKLYPDTKIICCVRSIPWILDSFENIFSKNCLYDTSSILEDDVKHTVITRCNSLMSVESSGQVIKPLFFLEEGLAINPEMILLVEYDELCLHPKQTMEKIYSFIKQEYFNHNFKNVGYKNKVFDTALNLQDLHTVSNEVFVNKRKTILPKLIWDKYSGFEFWRNSSQNYAQKNVAQFKVGT